MASDQRKRPRMPIRGAILVTLGSGQQIHGQAMDVSLLGFRFSAEELLVIGGTVTASIVFPSGRAQMVQGTIQSISSGTPYQYGVIFAQETTERIIREFIRLS